MAQISNLVFRMICVHLPLRAHFKTVDPTYGLIKQIQQVVINIDQMERSKLDS